MASWFEQYFPNFGACPPRSWLRSEAPSLSPVLSAAIVHYRFLDIHPFGDGNGRTGRLLEKWFLAQMLAKKPGLY